MRPLTIRFKLLAIFLVAAVLPIAVVSLVSYRNSLRAVEQMVGNRTDKLALSVKDELSRKLGRRLGDRILVVNRPLQDFLTAVDERSESPRATLVLQRYAKSLFEEYGSYYRDLVVADAKGELVFSFGHSQLGFSSDEGRPPPPSATPVSPPLPPELLDSLAVALPEEIPLPGELARSVEAFSRKLSKRLREEAQAMAARDSLQANRNQNSEKLQEDETALRIAEALERVAQALPAGDVQGILDPEAPTSPGQPRLPPRIPTIQQTESDKELQMAADAGLKLKEDENLVYIHRSSAGTSESVRLVRPVFSVDHPGERLGALILDLRADYLFPEDLSSERFGTRGQLAVVNRGDGEILYHSQPEWVGQSLRSVDPQVAGLLQKETASSEGWTHLSGEQGGRIASVANLDSGLEAVPWTVIATAFPREFASEARRAGILNLAVASLALLLALVVLLVSSGRISSSVQVVTRGAREIAAGNLGHSIQVHTHDEIQTLADTFNIMTASLRESIELREKAAEELAALNRTLEDRVHERTRELEALNDALNSANQELKELDRLKSNFLATVSHEFKTPLTSIKAFSEILLDETEERGASAETRRFLNIINTESERLGRLIKNLLDLSRIEAGRMRWDRSTFQIQDVLSAALDGLLPVFKEKDIQVVEEVECRDAVVEADRDRIQQVVTNLLENAVKFSRKGSRVWLSCRPRMEEGNGTPCLLIGVRDEGTGIPEDHLVRIFERFSQVDSTDTRGAGGSGLGLAISREIVEHHGGRIWAESSLGKGARFLFTLPCRSGKNFPPPGVAKEMRHAEEGLGL